MRVWRDIRFKRERDCLYFRVLDGEAASFAAVAIDQRHNLHLMATTATAHLNALAAANVGLVDLNQVAVAAHRRQVARREHSFADAVSHKPRRAVGAKAEHPVELVSRHALLA